MNIEFIYMDEITDFIQILVLGGALSFIVIYIVEAFKGVVSGINSKFFIAIAFAVSMLFGIAWAHSFARETIDAWLSLWLGISLFLGSQGFYRTLEESDGFIGKAFQSYSEYLSEKELKYGGGKTDDPSGGDTAPPSPQTPNKQPQEDAVTENSVLTLSNGKDSHFKVGEFKCGCQGKYCSGWGDNRDINWAYAQLTKRNGATKRSLTDVLEEIRAQAQKKYNTEKGLSIMDGIRCRQYDDILNKGASTTGQHKKGLAADISMAGVSTAEIAKSVNSDGGVGTGSGHYPHVDRRGYKERWTY